MITSIYHGEGGKIALLTEHGTLTLRTTDSDQVARFDSVEVAAGLLVTLGYVWVMNQGGSVKPERHMGVWRLTVTGPEALLDAIGEHDVEVAGIGGDGDEMDRRNLEFDAANQVARDMGYESYDDLPDQYTPMAFGEPELTHNQYVTAAGTQQWFVGVYLVDRCCGGPEEGGWWFDTGELVQQTAVNSRDEAEALRTRLRDEFPDTGKSSSVLGGEDYRIAIGIEPHATHFPENVPHYE